MYKMMDTEGNIIIEEIPQVAPNVNDSFRKENLRLNHDCCKEFENTSLLNIHIGNKHVKTDTEMKAIRKVYCDFCGTIFSSKWSCLSHIKFIHLGLKQHKCRECHTSYPDITKLNSHIRSIHGQNYQVHTKYAPTRQEYVQGNTNHVPISPDISNSDKQCSYCGKIFSCRSNCHTHVKAVHLGQRDHNCQQCPSAFVSNAKLQLHIKVVHLGLKDYKCEICGKMFTYESQLRKHKVVVHIKPKIDYIKLNTNTVMKKDTATNNVIDGIPNKQPIMQIEEMTEVNKTNEGHCEENAVSEEEAFTIIHVV